jgi:hypothetical protein
MIPRFLDGLPQTAPSVNKELTITSPATVSEEVHNFNLTASKIDLGYVGFASLDLPIDLIHGRSSTCRRLSTQRRTCPLKMIPLRLRTTQMHGAP